MERQQTDSIECIEIEDGQILIIDHDTEASAIVR